MTRTSVIFLATSTFLGMAAYAAEPATGAGSNATSGERETLDEIVVTARRKEELLQDIPQTVRAVTPAQIEKLNLQNLMDLSGVVPGLQIATTGSAFNNNNTLRGVTFVPSAGTQNTVAFYVDDVPVTNNQVSTTNFDIGQIEILSGPQGTLRGEPAPTGSLTITTRKPDLNEYGGYVTATRTNHGNTNINGAVNLPLIQDKFAVRLAGIGDDDFYNDVRSINSPVDPFNHTYGARASIRVEPIDAVGLNVVYQHMYAHQRYFDQVSGAGAPGGVNVNAPAGYNGPALDPLQRLSVETYPQNEYTKTDLISGALEWHVLGQIASYNYGYTKYEINNSDPGDLAHQAPGITASNPIPRQAFQFDTPSTSAHTRTHELRLASETPLFGLMDYTAGFFYRNTVVGVNVGQLAAFLPGAFGSPLDVASPNVYNPQYTLQLRIESPKHEQEYSEFAHLTFHLPSSTELAVGGRFLRYENRGYTVGNLTTDNTFIASPLPFPCALAGFGSTYPGTCDIPASAAFPSTVALPQVSQNASEHTAIYNVSLSHKFSDTLLGYISSGSSWRPPAVAVGINNGANDPLLTSLVNVKSEKSYAYEAGFKWTFLENRGRFNAAFYHQRYEGFIYFGLPTAYLANNGVSSSVQSFNFITNPDAVVNGVDFDTGFKITPEWSVDLAASYANGHLTGSNVPCNPPSGRTTPAAFPPGTYVFECPSHASTSTTPNFNASLQSEYDLPITRLNNVDAFIRGLYVFYGRNPHANQFYVVPSYGLANLYLGMRSRDGAWEASLFAKNLFDTQRLLNIGYPTAQSGGLDGTFGSSGYYQLGQYAAGLTPPQEFGLTVTYSIGSR